MAKVICAILIVLIHGCFGKPSNNVMKKTFPPIRNGDPPLKWDWRDHGVITPVKNQGVCNAGWAFAVAGAIESYYNIYMQQTTTLSEQFLIDCNGINAGCNHTPLLPVYGDLTLGTHGIASDDSYRPYNGSKEECVTNKASILLVEGYSKVWSEYVLTSIIYHYGPVTASINSASMRKYDPNATVHGIDLPSEKDCPYDGPPNPCKYMDHTVLIVGYDVYVSEDKKESIPYWIIKNSWGEDWGHKGYYYLVRGKYACGIGFDVAIPFL